MYNAGYGWFLKGRGNGDFSLHYPVECGFVVRGEVRNIKKIQFNYLNYILIARNNTQMLGYEVNNP
jgi:hypothetical protein